MVPRIRFSVAEFSIFVTSRCRISARNLLRYLLASAQGSPRTAGAARTGRPAGAGARGDSPARAGRRESATPARLESPGGGRSLPVDPHAPEDGRRAAAEPLGGEISSAAEPLGGEISSATEPVGDRFGPGRRWGRPPVATAKERGTRCATANDGRRTSGAGVLTSARGRSPSEPRPRRRRARAEPPPPGHRRPSRPGAIRPGTGETPFAPGPGRATRPRRPARGQPVLRCRTSAPSR